MVMSLSKKSVATLTAAGHRRRRRRRTERVAFRHYAEAATNPQVAPISHRSRPARKLRWRCRIFPVW